LKGKLLYYILSHIFYNNFLDPRNNIIIIKKIEANIEHENGCKLNDEFESNKLVGWCLVRRHGISYSDRWLSYIHSWWLFHQFLILV